MKFIKHLANLGYGSRREVMRMFEHDRITHANGEVLDKDSAFAHEDVRIDGEPLDPPPGCVVMLNKPVGYVCSTQDINPLVYALLPPRFRERSPIVAPVGRLDRDTSGLLLLTDDGGFNHRLTSPRTHVTKVYEATLAEPLRGDEAAVFAAGSMLLEGETDPLKPAVLQVVSDQCARVTLTEGRYHQVRRMFASVGNHVLALQRVAIGGLELGELPMGEWRLVDAGERASLFSR